MNTYKIFTVAGSSLVWTCKANSEEEAWETLVGVKKLPVKELKKLFKIEQYVDRTSNNN
jgi:hypothetical protein